MEIPTRWQRKHNHIEDKAELFNIKDGLSSKSDARIESISFVYELQLA